MLLLNASVSPPPTRLLEGREIWFHKMHGSLRQPRWQIKTFNWRESTFKVCRAFSTCPFCFSSAVLAPLPGRLPLPPRRFTFCFISSFCFPTHVSQEPQQSSPGGWFSYKLGEIRHVWWLSWCRVVPALQPAYQQPAAAHTEIQSPIREKFDFSLSFKNTNYW